MANYITCKDTRSFAYSETTNKGYYEIISVSEDGINCTVKCVYHEDKRLIGKEYELINERVTEDFEAADEIKVFEAIERAIIGETDWRVWATTTYPYADTVGSNLSSWLSKNTNVWNANSYKDIRKLFYIPNNESTEFPCPNMYYYNGSRDSVASFESIVSAMVGKGRDYTIVESVIVMEDNIFDEALSSAKVITGVDPISLPDDLKMHLRSQEYKAVVFHKDNVFIYVTNVRCDHIVFSSMVYTAEQMGRPLSEEAKAALLARDQEAYNAAIFANIEEAVAGIEKRAKEKMFVDFSSKFGEMALKPMKDSLHNLERKYEDKLTALNDVLNQLQTAREKLFYAEHGISSVGDEFIAFINDIKDNIVSIKIDGNLLFFCVRTFLTYWDDELWEVYRKSDSRFTRLKDWQKCMLDDMFTNHSVKLLFEQRFYFDLHYNEVGRDCNYGRKYG